MITKLRPFVRSQSDLHAVWKELMGPWGFGGHSLWLLVIDADDRPVYDDILKRAA
jgi:hypothetical protein